MNKSTLLSFFLLIGNVLNAQFIPTNQKRIGGYANDQMTQFFNPNDLSYSYLIGTSASWAGGHKTENSFGGDDIWIVKLSASGTKIWDKTIGGSNSDMFASAVITDEAIFIGASTRSDLGGNKTVPSNGDSDAWLIRMDHQGTITHQNSYGGDQSDGLFTMSLEGNQLILLCVSQSGLSGNKTSGTYGGSDIWILQINTTDLSIDAQHHLGSPFNEAPRALEKIGSNYFIACSSEMGTGNDKTETGYGSGDVWLLKTDLNFNLLEDKCFGGSESDYPENMCQLNGELFITTVSYSNTSGNKTHDNFGSMDAYPKPDCWILKVDPVSMDLVWDFSFGGTDTDAVSRITVLDDNRMIISMYSLSAQNTGNISSPDFGLYDTKYLVINPEGDMLTQFSMGGSGQDYCRVSLVNNGIVYFSGFSDSDISGNKTVGTIGGFDAWFCRMSLVTLGIEDLEKEQLLSIYPNPSKEYIYITADGLDHPARGEITDLKGVQLKSFDYDAESPIYVSDLPSGVYFIEVNGAVSRFVRE